MAQNTAPQESEFGDTRGNRRSGSAGSEDRWWDRLAFHVTMLAARPLFRRGRLEVIYGDKGPVALGDGSGPICRVRLDSARFLRHLLPTPDLAIGEGYVDGQWTLTEGDLAQLIGLLLRNDEILRERVAMKALSLLFRCLADPNKVNDPSHSRRNVAHHYDIGNDLYRAFLDEGMNYSCAFFERPDQSLRDAELNKIRTSIHRLGVAPGMSVLDIGCGWGELTRAIAGETEAERVVGITLAEEQYKLARARVAPEHGNRLSYALEDYRLHATQNPGAYDRIVSIGMFEHVGKHQFVTYFRAIKTMLKSGGAALVHTIVKPHQGTTSPWIDKYIFPGGYIPTVGELVTSATQAGLRLTAEPFIHESFHYANTLRHWRRRFNENYPSLDPRRYDARFRRMWNFYLAGSEAAFDATDFQVAQVRVEKAA
jgi:cyclopropane-fatty-acyl-phospholipid synthase